MQNWKEQARNGQEALETIGRCLNEAKKPAAKVECSTVQRAAAVLETPRLSAYIRSTSKPEQPLPLRLSDGIQKLNARTKKMRKLQQQLAQALVTLHTLVTVMRSQADAAPGDTQGDDDSPDNAPAISSGVQSAQQWVMLLGTISAAVGKECEMCEVITAHVDHGTSSDQLEAYSVFWALHPYTDDDCLSAFSDAFNP